MPFLPRKRFLGGWGSQCAQWPYYSVACMVVAQSLAQGVGMKHQLGLQLLRPPWLFLSFSDSQAKCVCSAPWQRSPDFCRTPSRSEALKAKMISRIILRFSACLWSPPLYAHFPLEGLPCGLQYLMWMKTTAYKDVLTCSHSCMMSSP